MEVGSLAGPVFNLAQKFPGISIRITPLILLTLTADTRGERTAQHALAKEVQSAPCYVSEWALH